MGQLLREFDLVRKGDLKICNQATPLHLAATNENTEVLEFLMPLLKLNNPKDKKGRTPLHYAAKYGQINSTKVIIPFLEARNPPDNYGWTPLHIASVQGNFEVFKIIASYVDNKNVKTFKSGDTPLHLAVLEGNMDIVEYLIHEISEQNPTNHIGLSSSQDAINELDNMIKFFFPSSEDKESEDYNEITTFYQNEEQRGNISRL